MIYYKDLRQIVHNKFTISFPSIFEYVKSPKKLVHVPYKINKRTIFSKVQFQPPFSQMKRNYIIQIFQ